MVGGGFFFGDRIVVGDDKFLSLAITRSIGGFPELGQVQRYKHYQGGKGKAGVRRESREAG